MKEGFFGSIQFNMVIFPGPDIRDEMVEWLNWQWTITAGAGH